MRPRHRAAEYVNAELSAQLRQLKASMRPRHRAAEYSICTRSAYRQNALGFNEAAA